MPDGDAVSATDAGESATGGDDPAVVSDSFPGRTRPLVTRWDRQSVQAKLDPRQTTLSEWDGDGPQPAGGTSLTGRAARTVLSPRLVVALGLVVDLLFRFLIDVGPAVVATAELLAPFVSLSAGTVTPAVVGRVTTWLVLAAVVYAIAPRVFPASVRAEFDAVGFRLLFVGLAVVFPVIVETTAGLWTLLLWFVWLVGGSIAMAAYARRRLDWQLLNPAGNAVGLVDTVMQADLTAERRTDQQYTGLTGMLADGLWILLLGLVVCLPAFVTGVLVSGLVNSQPLPDLLAVGVLVSRLVGSEWLPSEGVERRVVSNAREATRTLKGTSLVLVCAIAAAITTLVLSAVLQVTPGLLAVAVRTVSESPDTTWIVVGAVGCLLTGAVQLLWVWLRLFRRLPSFLAGWRGAGEVPRVTTARPAGSVAPGLVALTTGGGCFVLFGTESVPAVGWLWPLGLLPAVVAVVVTRRRDGRLSEAVAPASEDLYVVVSAVVSLLLQVTGVWAFERLATGQPLAVRAVGGTVTVFAVVSAVFPTIAYFPDVNRYANEQNGYRQYLDSAFLVVLGSVLLAVGLAVGTSNGLAICVIGTIAVLGGLTMVATTRMESA